MKRALKAFKTCEVREGMIYEEVFSLKQKERLAVYAAPHGEASLKVYFT